MKGELTPTILRGRAPRSDDEMVVGSDTLEAIGADLGDVVPVQIQTAFADGEDAGERMPMRIVGVATFPPVNQIGTDMARLGIGVLDRPATGSFAWAATPTMAPSSPLSAWSKAPIRSGDRGQPRRLPGRGAEHDRLVHRHGAGRAAPARRGEALPARGVARGVRDPAGGRRARALVASARQPPRSRGAPRDRMHPRPARHGDRVAGDPVRVVRGAARYPDRDRVRTPGVHAVRAVPGSSRRRVDPGDHGGRARRGVLLAATIADLAAIAVSRRSRTRRTFCARHEPYLRRDAPPTSSGRRFVRPM